MSPRSTLPGADELFRPTSAAAASPDAVPAPPERDATDRRDLRLAAVAGVTVALPAGTGGSAAAVGRRPLTGRPTGPSGRERHTEKITVYVSPDELVQVEQARLTLRAEHGLVVDRGRIVREALAHLLADLADRGPTSTLVRRLAGP